MFKRTARLLCDSCPIDANDDASDVILRGLSRVSLIGERRDLRTELISLNEASRNMSLALLRWTEHRRPMVVAPSIALAALEKNFCNGWR